MKSFIDYVIDEFPDELKRLHKQEELDVEHEEKLRREKKFIDRKKAEDIDTAFQSYREK